MAAMRAANTSIDFRNPSSYYATLRANILRGGEASTPPSPQVD
jgi:P pilus assembly chaperone PapD